MKVYLLYAIFTLFRQRINKTNLKIDHIRTILGNTRVKSLWQEKYGKEPVEKDAVELNKRFEPVLMANLKAFAQPLPEMPEVLEFLRKHNIKIGSTTGYTREMMKIVTKEAGKHGYTPDSLVTPDAVENYGRPYPYMIFKNMQNLGLKSPATVVKIGDTCSDIKEAANAGVWAVGVIVGSSEMGLSYDEFSSLSGKEKKSAISEVKKRFKEKGADFTIESMADVPKLIANINKKLYEGERPRSK